VLNHGPYSCLLRNDQLLLELVPCKADCITNDGIPDGCEGGAGADARYEDWDVLVTFQDTADPGPLVSSNPSPLPPAPTHPILTLTYLNQ
jgi:hypothetical protein